MEQESKIVEPVESAEAKIKLALERHGLTQEQATNQWERTVSQIISEGLNTVADRYGVDGEGASQEGKLAFHDLSHSLEFIDDAMELHRSSTEAGIIPSQGDLNFARVKFLIALGASYHDIEQNLGPGENEDASWLELEKTIRDKSLAITDQEKRLLNSGIEATKVKNYQTLEQEISRPADTLEGWFERLFADSDLSAFLKFERQHWRGNRLFWELRNKQLKREGQPIDKPLEIAEVDKWFDAQINVLQNHAGFWQLKDQLKEHQPYNRKEDLKNIELYQKLINLLERQGAGISQDRLHQLLSIKKEDCDQIKYELGL